MEVDHKQVKQTLQSCPVEHPDIIEEWKSETSHEKESSEELIIFSDEAEQEEGENEEESKGSNSQNSSNKSDDIPSDHNSKPDQRAIARKLGQYYEDGLTAAEVLEKNIRGFNKATVYRHYTTLKNEGTNIRKKGSGRFPSIGKQVKDEILNMVRTNDRLTLKEMEEKLTEKGLKGSHQSIWLYLKSQGYRSTDPIKVKVLSNKHKKDSLDW